MEECPHCHRKFDEIIHYSLREFDEATQQHIERKATGCYDCLRAKGLLPATTVAA